jgi:hypothetical protein
MRDASQVTLKLIEPPFVLKQPENDHYLPTARDHIECDFSRATDVFRHNGILEDRT